MKFDKLSPNLLSGIVSILFGIFIYYKIPTEVEKPVLIFGQSSSEIDPQIVPTIIAFMFLIFGIYTVLYEKDSIKSNSWPKVTKNLLINISATILFLILYSILFQYLGNIVIPLSLILLGYSLSNLMIKNLTKGFIYSIARFLIGILSALIVIYAFQISGPKAGVILIMSTMPVALLNYIFTVQIDKDTTTVAGLVVVSTFSTLICLPFLLNLLLIYFN